jgi:hypothetical protein
MTADPWKRRGKGKGGRVAGVGGVAGRVLTAASSSGEEEGGGGKGGWGGGLAWVRWRGELRSRSLLRRG